ncbi:hypothetical protein ACIRD2_26875 [Streptomyces sp. NPDC093595]|uniref:hypothetical protein n=1 Tax=Streptomyces sp. NPDC093595 TaxID=3366045 RepID=UPI00380E3AD1
MADERDEWLDQDAAERLLRGEPVDPVDDHTRELARRLTEALEAVRAESPATSPVPGEEAALAAFREAREAKEMARARVAGASSASSAGASGADLGAVRLRSGRPRKQVRGRWARPVRWGLAASVAGLAAGGVAVAASTGVLPVLGDQRPLPASSSSPVAPGPLRSGEPTGGTEPDGPGAPSGPGSLPPGKAASPTPPAPGRTAPGGPGQGDDNVSGGTGTGTGGSGGADAGTGAGSWYARTAQACRDHRDGRLGTDGRRHLELSAKGDSLTAFCDKLLTAGTRSGGALSGGGTGRTGGSGGSGGSGDSGGSGGSGGEDGDASGGAGDDSDRGHHGSKPGGKPGGGTGKGGGKGTGPGTGKGGAGGGGGKGRTHAAPASAPRPGGPVVPAAPAPAAAGASVDPASPQPRQAV